MSKLNKMRLCYGACQMVGAASALLTIQDAVVIFNSPRWCALTAERELNIARRDYEQRLYCTEASQESIVFGIESSLHDTLEEIFQERSPKLVGVISSCSMSLIGDDVSGICKKYNAHPCFVAIDSGGLKGGFSAGFAAALVELLKNVDNQVQPLVPGYVNLWGLSTSYPHAFGDAAELKRILELAGIKVNMLVGIDEIPYNEASKILAASLNVIMDPELGLPAAKFLEERFHIPYLVTSIPYGFAGTRRWLQSIAEAIGCKPELGAIDAEIESMKVNLQEYCSWIEHNILDYSLQQVVCSLTEARSKSLIKAFKESNLDMLRYEQALVKNIEAHNNDNNVVLDYEYFSDLTGIIPLHEGKLRLLLASDRERSLLGKYAQTIFLNLDMPAQRLHSAWTALMGIRGWENLISSMAEQIITLKSISRGM